MTDRFWSLVDKTPGFGPKGECWKWLGAPIKSWSGGGKHNGAGYGRISTPGNRTGSMPAHKFSYILHKGKVPKGLVVRHLCHERLCVNPVHLEIGTQRDNFLDSGARNVYWPTTLKAEDIVEIRRLRAAGRKLREIAAQFGISQASACRIAKGRRWQKPGDLSLP